MSIYKQFQDEKKAFLDTLAKDPYDKTTRLIFANWLSEKGLDDEATEQREWSEEWQRAKEGLEELSTGYGIPFNVLIEAGKEAKTYQSVCFSSTRYPEAFYDDDNRKRFFKYWQVYMKEKLSKKVIENTIFRCAC